MGIPHHEVEKVMRQRVLDAFEYGWINVMTSPDTGEITMALTNFDLVTYLALTNDSKKDFNFSWWKEIKELSEELEGPYMKSINPKKGEMMYMDIGACKREYTSLSNTEYFWFINYLNAIQKGYRVAVGRISNRIITKVSVRMGA